MTPNFGALSQSLAEGFMILHNLPTRVKSKGGAGGGRCSHSPYPIYVRICKKQDHFPLDEYQN